MLGPDVNLMHFGPDVNLMLADVNLMHFGASKLCGPDASILVM